MTPPSSTVTSPGTGTGTGHGGGTANGSLAAQLRWLLHALRRWRWPALRTAWGLAVLGAAGVMLVPQRFEASARVYVDTQTVLKPMMAGLTYQPDIEQQVRMLARTLISRPNIKQLVEQPKVGPRFGTPAERERAIPRLMDRIKIAGAAERANLFTILYRDTDPQRALAVVDGTVALFVGSGEADKRQSSLDAVRFIDEQLQANEAQLVQAEERLKEFKLHNFGVSGISTQDYFVRISALGDEVNKLRSDLDAAQHARDAYRHELAGEDPQLPAESLPGAATAAPAEIDQRIEAQHRELDTLLRRFTELHPDVIGARRLLARLQAQKSEAQAAKVAARAAGVPGNAATSPVYQRIRVLLAENEAQVASLQSQLRLKSAQLDQVRALAGRLPQVEAELAQVTRNYEVLHKNHDQLLARRESALLGVKVDESKQLAEFRVTEPPNLSPAPVFPARKHLAAAAMLLALLGGMAAALVLELRQPTVNDRQALQQLSGRPVLGSVARCRSEASRRRLRRELRRLAGATALLLVCQGTWLAWVVARQAGAA